MRLLLLAGVVLALSGCSLIAGERGPLRDRSADYLRATPSPPLVYPEGLTALPARELYPVPALERRRLPADGKVEVPLPPQLVTLQPAGPGAGSGAGQPVPDNRVILTEDGNGFPVLMLDLDFDWAWQAVGDALRRNDEVKVKDLDRGRAVYYVEVDGKPADSGEPWELKLNYTANGIQVALQVDENAMAPEDLAAPLMKRLKEDLR